MSIDITREAVKKLAERLVQIRIVGYVPDDCVLAKETLLALLDLVEKDQTNPFALRPRPQKSIRLMNEAERRTANLDPNGGFDGPTGAD